jgi:hypothetical protein
MKTLLIEGDYTMVFVFVLGIMLGVPLILTIIGISCRNKHPKTSKVLFIIAGVYLLISLGVCGSMML